MEPKRSSRKKLSTPKKARPRIKQKAKVSQRQGEEAFSEFKAKAGELLKDKKKALAMLKQASEKADRVKASIEEVWENLQLFFQFLSDYLSGKYKKVPLKAIIALVAGVLYFLSPIDLFFDFIPGFGYIDDVFIIHFVFSQLSQELDQYKAWKKKQEVSPKKTSREKSIRRKSTN